jgi:hypothetical protein
VALRHSAEDILAILDDGARGFVFPMLDNGYYYLAASRLNLYRSPDDWALVFEIFGFSPRAFEPDLQVVTFGSTLVRGDLGARFPDAEAREAYLRQHPHDEIGFHHPIGGEVWIGEEEDVAEGTAEIEVRGETVPLPADEAYRRAGIERERPDRTFIFELCRALACERREAVLATEEERRANLPAGVERLLVLDDWHHPDLAAEVLPSETATFRELAAVLAAGDPDLYRASEEPNTHWSNWPEGGTL